MRDLSDYIDAVFARDRITAVDILKTLFDQPVVAEAFRTRGLSTASILDATYLLDDVSERGAQLRSTPKWQKLDAKLVLNNKMTDLAIELWDHIGNPQFGQELRDAKASSRPFIPSEFKPTVGVLRDARSFTRAILVSLRDRVSGMGVTAKDVDALIAALE
ncbi:MAG: hypothetical protein ABSE64_05730 [Vulcanimicrobiaceae bacterium]